MDENRKKLYDQLSANYDMGTFDEFDSDLDNEDNQKVAWEAMGGQDGYGDFGLFQQAIARSPQAADAVNTGNTENTGSVDAPTDTTAATEPLQPSDDRTATEIQHPTTPKDEPAEDEEIVNEPDAENTVSAPVAEKTVETDVVEPVRYDFTGKDADGAIETINSLDDDNKRFNAYYDYSEQKMRSGQQKAATGLATARPMQQAMTAPSWSGRYNTLVQEVSDGTGGMTSPLKRGMERHYDRYNQNIDQARGMTDEQLRTRIDQLMTADYGREGDEMRAVDVVPLVQELMARQNGGHAQTIGERIADEYLSSHPELAEEYRKWQRSEAGYDSNTFEATPLTLIDMVKKEIDRRVKVANRLDAQRNIIPTDPVTERSNAVSRGVDITSAYNITDALRSAERVYGTNRFESYVVAFAAKHNMTVPQARERVRELVTMSVAQDIISALEPGSNTEYVLRKALTDNMVMNLARAGMTLASGAKPGDVGLFDMEDKAMAHYEQTHTSGWDQFMQVVATTSSFVVEGLGGGGFVLPGIVGKVVGNAAMKALSRAGGGLFWKRLVAGSLGGAANFGAFESQMEAVRQLKTGERNPDALWHSLASGLAKGAGFGAVGESIGRLFWHSRGWMVPVGEVVKLAGETATFSAIGYLETGQLTPKDWATNFGMALGGKLTHPVQYIADVKKRMDGGFGPKVQSISGAYRDELTQKGYGTLAKVLHDGVLAQEDIGRVRDELSRMRSDNDVPMQTLQLAEFALNGRVLPCAPATGYRSTHQADGTWTLTPLDPSGRPLGESITVKGTDAKNAAEREMKRQIEKNAVTLSEYSSRGADVTRAVGKAVMSYCDTSGEDPMAVYSVYQEALRKSGNNESLGEVERQILYAVGRRLDDTTRIDNGIESYKRTSREAGYDIDKILDKPVAERTAGERKALDEYKTWLGDREEQAHSDNIADFAEWVQRSDEAAASNSARIAREYEQRAEELRGHVEELRGRMDMGNVVVLENIDQVEDAGVRRQIEQAERKGERGVPGWYDESTDTTYVYLPHAESIEDLDRTIMHEQVTHHGLRVLKTQGYNDLCDRVWNSMSDAERDRWENYPGVKGIDDQTKRQRAAADEYIANLAERTDPESAGLWSRFVAWAKEGMRSLGIRTDRISDAELEQIIRESYRNLRQQRGERVEPTEETEVRQDNEVALNPEGEAPREEIAEPMADEVAAPTETVEAPADSEDTGTVDTGGDELPVRSAAAQTDGTAADTHDIRELYPNDYGEITGESLDMYLEAAEQSRKQAHDYANGEAERPDENVWRYWASRDGLTDPAERQAEPVATEPIVEETPVQEPAETPVETPAEAIAANDGRLPRGANADAATIDPKDLPESGHIANMADAWGEVTRVEVVGQNADGTTRVKVWFKNRPNQRGIDVNVDMGGTPQPPEPPTTPPSEPTGSTDDQRMSQTLDETLGSEPEVDKTAADYMPMENKGGGRMSPNWEKATAEQVVNYVLREDVTDSPRTMMEERVRVAQERVEKIRKERPFKGDARSAQQERKLSTWQNRLDKAEQQLGKMRQAESALREELIARQRARGEEEIRNRQTIAQLTDTVSDHVDEMDLADYVAYQIGTGKSKLKWKDQEKGTGRTHGLGGHLGLSGSSAERKARRAFIDDKNGLWPEEYAELLYANMPEGLRARYSDRDVLNAVLDVMRGASSRVGIMQDLASRWGSGETLEQRIERERDELDRQQEEDMREQQEVDEQMRRNDVAATEGAEAVVDADYADLIADARARLADPNASEFEKQAARAVLRFRQRDGRDGVTAQETDGGGPRFRMRDDADMLVDMVKHNNEVERQRRDAVTDFVKAVTDVDELTDSKFATALGKVMRGQRAYDQATVADITTMVKAMMDTGLLTELDNFAVKQILTKVKDSTGKNDITAEANKLIDIMLKNQLRRGKRAFEQQLKVKGMRQDSRGVVVQGGLDYHGQRAAKALKEGLSLGDLQAVNDRIDEAEQRLSDPDEVVRGNAADELDGLYIARQYYDEIKQSEINEANIKSQLEQAQADHKNGTLSDEAYKQLRQASNDALRELRCERVDAWARLNEQLSGSQSESAARAKQFREQQKQRQAEIQHWANSDMEGHSADPHEQETRKNSAGDKARDVAQTVLQPLGTFDKLMRYFGNAHPKGEGYLFGFVRRFMNVRDQWFKERKADFDQMDTAARRIGAAHGARVKVKLKDGTIAPHAIKDWADVYTYINQQKPLTVTVKGKDYEITQGNATYLLAMEGQADGRMKLRTMGLTEADMDALRGQVDPMLLELSQWVIHGLLPGMRPRLNATHLRMFGADMTDIPNYFPIRTSELARNETVNLAQQNGKIRPATITGSIVERKRNNLDLDLGADFFQVTAEHIDEMNHWNSFAEFARDLNTLLSYKRFKAQVHNLHSWRYGNGADIWKTLEDTAAITTGDYQPKTSKADTIINGATKGLAAANITFRPYTGLKQLLSAPVYLVQARWDDIGYAIANLKGTWQWAIKNLPTFAERWQGRMAGDPILTQGEQERGSQNKKLRTASKWGFAFNAAVDATTVAIGARAIYRTKYRRYKDMGYSDEQANQKALEDASISVNETQQSGLGAFTSVIQQDRTFWSRALTIYRNASMGYQRQLVEGLKAMRNGVSAEWRATAKEKVAKKLERDGIDSAMAAKVADRLANREAMRGVALAAMFGSIAPFAWSLGAQYLGYKMAGGDDDEQEDKMLGQASTHLLSGWVEGIVFGGQLSSAADFAYDYYHGRKKLRDYSLQRDLVSDMAEQILGKSSGKPADAVYDIVNMIVAMSTGVNPKSIVEPTVGIIDVVQNWGGDAKLAHEVALGWCRLLNVPQTSLDQVYVDEIGLSAKDAKQLSAEQFAERWCRYKRRRGAGWMSPLTSDESDAEQEGKLLKRYERMMDERFESLSDERVEQIMRESDDELLKKHAAKAYKSRIDALSDDDVQAAIVPLSDSAPQDSVDVKREGIKRAYKSEGMSYSKPGDDSKNALAYERHATYDDIAEDAALKGRKDALKKSVGDEFEKMGVKYKNGSAGWDWYADDDASASIDEIKAYYQSHKAELDEYGILSWWFGTGKGSSGYIKKGFSSKDKSAGEVMKEYRDTRKQVLSRTKRR